MAEKQGIAELLKLKIVNPIKECFKEQRNRIEKIEKRCQDITNELEQQKKYTINLEKKIEDLAGKQRQLLNTLEEERSRRMALESAISSINWEE
jgi:predicted  nucleic acid-binding Zn-ribbon protein